jgi:hypothetical protein
MNTNIIWIVLGAYFALGLVAILLLDLFTGRVRRNFATAQEDARQKLLATGNYMGHRASWFVMAGALWLFWPVALYGVMRNSGDDNGEEKRETPPESTGEKRDTQ